MRAYRQLYHKSQGYTLIELSIIIGIVALLVGTTLSLGVARIDSQKVDSTKQRITLIESALKSFAEINGYLPCPADGTIKKGVANFGIQGANSGSCVGGTPAANFNDGANVVGGVVPVTTLGMAADMMYDAWGRKFTYVVDMRYTAAATSTIPSAFTFHEAGSQCGGITIKNESGTAICNNAIYVLISHGRDGHGAFIDANAAPFRLNTRNTNTSSQDNASYDGTYTDSFDANFRSHPYKEDATNVKNIYDDIVDYKTRNNIQLSGDLKVDISKITTVTTPSGWVYVPKTTLPSGTVVPSFEIMKYEAIDLAPADTIPDSAVAGVTTGWSNVSMSQARQACQKLTGITNPTGDGVPMEYDIPTETQWLAMAHTLSQKDQNWFGGCKSNTAGGLFQGHSDSAPANAISPASDTANDYSINGYYNTLNAATNINGGQYQFRTMILPDGSSIWDLAGNLREWTYCDLPADTTNAYTPCNGAYGKTDMAGWSKGQITTAGAKQYGVDILRAGGVNDIIPPYSWGNNQIVGRAVRVSATATGILRGGAHDSSSQSGLFHASLGETSISTNIGFRCVHNIHGTYNNSASFSPNNIANLDVWYDATDIDNDPATSSTTIATTEANINTTATNNKCLKALPEVQNNGCVEIWKNKAASIAGYYDAYSRMLNGTGGAIGTGIGTGYNATTCTGNDNCRPTLKLNAINGLPAVNFSSTARQWFDTYYGAAAGQTGYSFNGKTAFTLFFVANGTDLDAIISAGDDNASSWPHFVVFPFDIKNMTGHANNDYMFLVDNLMSGVDVTTPNATCSGRTATSAVNCTITAAGVQNYACAKMGGIDTTTNGLTVSTTHVGTGIFSAGTTAGMVAYVDGQPFDIANSLIDPSVEGIVAPAATCGGNVVDAKLMIGAIRNNTAAGTLAGSPSGFDGTQFTKGNVGEILIYNRVLTNQERILVERYLANKWGVTYKGP